MTTRAEQKQATRARILDVATNLLVERGYSALTTVAVQRAADLSRGALLHHFPTMRELTEALVANLVELNEATTQATAERIGDTADPIHRALTALYESMTRPPAQAEFELWAAARTDPELAAVLRVAERRAGRDLHRVIDTLFGPTLVEHSRYPAARELVVVALRGIAMSRPLRSSERADRATLEYLADAIRTMLSADTDD
ncbi:TetR/AcrR family transcriptional regulator [Nocardia altamirensis]|uniref:TetR/AcrR family transcriptional regulator n=1 Tax=Nocardia altamirensis TaxID=472158 RepID=UPI0008400581|nr:TetR/AcrR family transcriptional regulator [Nocardia altamirensis]